ncbi:MAG: glutamate 5-kinase [Deltaproteobacteria bacterium]|nr:glutamate 5-kinase [Deltaproteobacteria bacterium]
MKKDITRKDITTRARRIVVKVGSVVLAGLYNKGIEETTFNHLAKQIARVKKDGKGVILVSSGAIAIGMKRMGLKERPRTIPEKQAVAALGQGSLMALYEKAFSPFGVRVAQILLTHDDLGNRPRFLNARNTLMTLLGYDTLPIINENDTVAVEEIKFGDNDNLAALVTNLVEADLLIILTDIDGLYDKDPKRYKTARLIPLVEDADHLAVEEVGGTAGVYGVGGMASKIEAAKKAVHFGIPTIIANGTTPDILKEIFSGKEVGTLFLPLEDRLTSRKHWIAFSTRPTGRIVVDEGAKGAILERGKSLLPSGIKAVEGDFEAGEAVRCADENGREFARGLVNYSASEIERIKGLKTKEIEGVLGYKYYDEVIHRDNLVVL